MHNKHTPPATDRGRWKHRPCGRHGSTKSIPASIPYVNHVDDLALEMRQHLAQARAKWLDVNVPTELHAAVWRAVCELRRLSIGTGGKQ